MRLERSRTDLRLFGLCGGLARKTDISAGWWRFGLVAGTILTGGTLFFLYILVSMVVPKEPEYNVCGGGYWYAPAPQAYAFAGYPAAQPAAATGLEPMMSGLEERAMKREIEQLRAKLEQYEGH